MTLPDTELPPEVAPVLAWWRPRIRDLLGEALRGARLFGSVPLGGFEPAWSDLDVCVLLAAPVTGAQAEDVDRLHDEMEARFMPPRGSGWRSTQFFEGAYVPAGLAARPGATGRCLFVTTGRRILEDADPVPGFERLMLAHHSIPVLGEPPAFAPPPRRSLVEGQAWLPVHLARPAAEHSAVMLAGLLQETARTLVFFRDGDFLAKNHALGREIAAGGPFADAFRIALEVRRRGSAAAEARRPALAKAYGDVADPARTRLLQLMAP